MAIGICKYCGKQKKLCQAHIMPKSFYNLKSNSYFGISIDGKIDLTKCQHGLTDSNILCSECDGIIGEYDKYAKQLIITNIRNNQNTNFKTIQNGKIYYFSKTDFDYFKLHKFFISLSWRASISQKTSFSLGKYEDIALKIMKGEMKDNHFLFFPIIYHLNNNNPMNDVVYTMLGELNKQKYILLTFPDYQIYIITDVEPIKNLRLIKSLPFNESCFMLIESGEDINGIEQTVIETFKQCKNNNPKIFDILDRHIHK